MNRYIFAALAVCLCISPAAFAKDIESDSEITAVTVYANRASVTRTATVELPAGKHTVVFKDLPTILLPDSLRAEGTAKHEVTFGAVSHKRETTIDVVPGKAQELYKQIETLQDRIALVKTDQTALDTQRALLDNIGKQAELRFNEEIGELNVNPDDWLKAGAALQARTAEILKVKRENDVKIRDLNKEIVKLKTELADSGGTERSYIEVRVPLETETATKLVIDLSYQVTKATWKPIYDARLDTEEGTLELTQFGAVRQQTGEDWTDVALTLSTAQPHRGTYLPELQPRWLDLYDGRVGEAASSVYAKAIEQSNVERARLAGKMGKSAIPTPIGTPTGRLEAPDSLPSDPLSEWRRAAEARRMILADGDSEIAVPMPKREKTYEAKFVAANMDSGGFMNEYRIPGPATVPADNSESKLMIGQYDTDAKVQVHVKPQVSTDAFLVARLKLKGDAPVLPGQVSLFRDGAFTGKAPMDMLRPDEEYDLYFGIDDQVTLKRNVLNDRVRETGLIDRDNILERSFVTEPHNLHKQPVEIVAQETIPVPRTDEIAVAITPNLTTPGYKKDTDDVKGLLSWTFKLQGGEKKKLKLGWSITWPTGQQLSGL